MCSFVTFAWGKKGLVGWWKSGIPRWKIMEQSGRLRTSMCFHHVNADRVKEWFINKDTTELRVTCKLHSMIPLSQSKCPESSRHSQKLLRRNFVKCRSLWYCSPLKAIPIILAMAYNIKHPRRLTAVSIFEAYLYVCHKGREQFWCSNVVPFQSTSPSSIWRALSQVSPLTKPKITGQDRNPQYGSVSAAQLLSSTFLLLYIL